MKKIALITGGFVVANVITHLALDTIKASGGTVVGAASLALPYLLVPAPLRLMTRATKTA